MKSIGFSPRVLRAGSVSSYPTSARRHVRERLNPMKRLERAALLSRTGVAVQPARRLADRRQRWHCALLSWPKFARTLATVCVPLLALLGILNIATLIQV